MGSVSGIDLSNFSPSNLLPFSEKSLRASLFDYLIDDSSFIFGYVGRLHPDKGLFTLLDAFLSLSDSITDAYLVLVGPLELTGPKLIFFEELLANNKNVIHIPYVTDTSSFYKCF